ncbi:MAG: hypothetical protein E7E84_07545 [Peptoniphilus lacydonensis]|uniref:hypothetical protein n=1 Tax=Peptoniphilus lacydonensis TaxID=1673725 RepID=UPI002900E24F|nr:hypothetical protein [Peptoniphilus lacydonensis]MDU2116181.1 hypothetical protein [Peptoniphilus lacydonensis]
MSLKAVMDELNEILVFKEKMKILQEEIVKLETLITKINKELNPIVVQSSKLVNNEDLILELIEMKNEYLNESVEFAKLKRKIIKKIIKMENKNEIVLIYRRYVLGMKLTEVAKSMKITYKWAQVLHKRGVNSFNNIV